MKLGFFVREALRSVNRNAVPSFAAIASVVVTVLVLGVFIPVVQATTGAANEVRGRVLVDVFLKTGAKDADVERVRRLLADKTPHVGQGAVRLQAGGLPGGEAAQPGGLPAAGLQPAARHLPRDAGQAGQRAASCATRSSPRHGVRRRARRSTRRSTPSRTARTRRRRSSPRRAW